MAGCQSCSIEVSEKDLRFRKILWIALFLNAVMFVSESFASYFAKSVSLQADAIDFLGDAANYGMSLFVLSKGVLWKARASQIKAFSMAAFGLWLIGTTTYRALVGEVPIASTMAVLGVIALIVNVSVALLLYRHRNGDSNARSVWLCSRNDAIGNIAVLLAALGVSLLNSIWPDLVVGLLIGSLGLASSMQVFRIAKSELNIHGV